MQVMPMTTLTSHKNSKMFFVISMAWRSSFILTTKVFYFTKTLFARNNITIHLIFPLQSIFFPKFSPTTMQTCIAHNQVPLGWRGKIHVCGVQKTFNLLHQELFKKCLDSHGHC
jgi:hypothetical protein